MSFSVSKENCGNPYLTLNLYPPEIVGEEEEEEDESESCTESDTSGTASPAEPVAPPPFFGAPVISLLAADDAEILAK